VADEKPMGTVTKRNSRSSQTGQALVEYILVLIVVVAIILGGILQLNKAFQFWANNYFGEYLTCLLETGELPALGAPDPNSECAQAYQAFQLASTGQGGQSGGGEGGGDSADGGSGQGGSRASGGNSDGAGGISSSGSSFGRGSPSRFRTRGSDDSGGSSIEEENASGSGSGSGGGYSDDQGPTSGQRFAVGSDFYGRGKGKKKDKSEEKVKTKGTVKEADEQKIGPKLIPVSRTVASPAEEPEIEGFSFGWFMRYLIIGAIILAIFIFIGGQALQLSKSMD